MTTFILRSGNFNLVSMSPQKPSYGFWDWIFLKHNLEKMRNSKYYSGYELP